MHERMTAENQWYKQKNFSAPIIHEKIVIS